MADWIALATIVLGVGVLGYKAGFRNGFHRAASILTTQHPEGGDALSQEPQA